MAGLKRICQQLGGMTVKAGGKTVKYDAHGNVEKKPRRVRCDECGKNWADYPSKICAGCEAYREHQWSF